MQLYVADLKERSSTDMRGAVQAATLDAPRPQVRPAGRLHCLSCRYTSTCCVTQAAIFCAVLLQLLADCQLVHGNATQPNKPQGLGCDNPPASEVLAPCRSPNVLLSREGVAKVADVGLMRAQASAADLPGSCSACS